MKKFIVTVLSMLMVMVLSGCENNQSKTQKETQRIGLVVSTLDNPFFVTLKDGAEKEAKTLGYNIIVLDSQNDPAKELANIEDLITKKVSALLVNPVDSDAVGNAIKLANKANIPVITLDRSASAGVVMSHVASDNVAGGRMAAEFLIGLLPEGANVVELEGIPGASAARERGKGFDNAVEGKLTLLVKQPADFDRTKGLNVMENILQAQKDINAVFAQNDEMALGALKAIEASGRSGILVVGFDATDDAVKAVEDGKLSATIAQRPAQIGAMGIDIANKIIKGQAVDSYIPIELELIVKQ